SELSFVFFLFFFFFFQAEDGIRDFHVTGVQTCALPIYHRHGGGQRADGDGHDDALATDHFAAVQDHAVRADRWLGADHRYPRQQLRHSLGRREMTPEVAVDLFRGGLWLTATIVGVLVVP